MSGRLVLKGNKGLYQVADSTNVETQLVDAATGEWVGPIGSAEVTYADIQDGTGLSVIGRSANSAGVNADIVAANDGEVLRRSGTSIGFGTIASAGIGANQVTLAKLATGITPSHIVKFAGQPTTVGGAAAEAFTVTGVAATDLAFVQIVNDGTANVTVLQAVCTLNTLTVTFSANPGNDTVFNYQILRAAA